MAQVHKIGAVTGLLSPEKKPPLPAQSPMVSDNVNRFEHVQTTIVQLQEQRMKWFLCFPKFNLGIQPIDNMHKDLLFRKKVEIVKAARSEHSNKSVPPSAQDTEGMIISDEIAPRKPESVHSSEHRHRLVRVDEMEQQFNLLGKSRRNLELSC